MVEELGRATQGRLSLIRTRDNDYYIKACCSTEELIEVPSVKSEVGWDFWYVVEKTNMSGYQINKELRTYI